MFHIIFPGLRISPRKCGVVTVLAASALLLLHAKDPTLTAIALYNGPKGADYAQIADVLINGKAEVRECGSAPKIDKSGYGKLSKIVVTQGASIEYGSNRVLTLTRDNSSQCVIPMNLQFDKSGPLAPAALAERAVLQGRVVSASQGASAGLPPLRRGMKLVFVAMPDVELAEYLRADYASTITWWQDVCR